MDTEREKYFRSILALGTRVLIREDLGPCLKWPGSTDKFGYGRVHFRGEYSQAHRDSWELAHGPIPPGKCVLHSCDYPPCVDDAHLFLGTKTGNAADRDSKGRQARGSRAGLRLHPEQRAYGLRNGTYTHPESRRIGEQNGRAKLTLPQVNQIRLAYKVEGINKTALAKRYGVSGTQISDIIHGRSWKNQ
jgi:hypothetical protein